MLRTGAKSSPIRLSWKEKDRQVIIAPQDNDLYVKTVQEIISALRAEGADARGKTQLQLQILLDKLGEWNLEHWDKLAGVYLTLRDTHLLFLVVMKGKTYDSQLEDDLTELDLSIARDTDFNLLSVSVLAIPCSDEDSAKSFLNKSLCFEYKGSHAK